MVKLELTRKQLLEALLGIIFLIIGIGILVWSYKGTGNVNFEGNVWNRRFYTFLAIIFCSLAFSMTCEKWYKKLIFFALCFAFLNIALMIFGLAISYDAANPTFDSAMVAYDTGFVDIAIGITVMAQAVNTIVPIVLLVLILYQVLYADEGGQMKAILEGIVCVIFIFAFNFMGLF